MKHLHWVGRGSSRLVAGAMFFFLLLSAGALTCSAQTTESATAPAAAAAPAAPAPLAPVDAPHADSSGNTGGDNSLITPNVGLPGWQGGGTDAKGTWHPYTDEKGNPTDTPNATSLAPNVAKSLYSVNIVWTLVCGYLVMFMQAGFALVETGLIRGKNVAHTFSMNFMIYAIGMFGFFVCGFAFMCGGANGTGAGRAGPVGRNSVIEPDVGHHCRWSFLGTLRTYRLLPDGTRL